MRSRICASYGLLLAAAVVAGCDDLVIDPPVWPEVARPRGATAAVFVLDLAGHGDVLAAGFDGGLALWDLSSGATRRVTRIDGLPSDHVAAIALDARAERLLAATRSGLASGWWEGAWASAFRAGPDCDREFVACTDRPGGGWVAGTTSGLLAAWTSSRLDTLRLPRQSRIIALTHARLLLEPEGRLGRAPSEPGSAQSRTSVPGLLPGLVIATETAGLWVLRSSGTRVAWLQLGVCDGLPIGRMRALVSDRAERVWVATDAGLACVGPGIAIRTWPADSLLGRPMRALSRAPDGWIYAALADGVVRIDTRADTAGGPPPVERVDGIHSPARALAWSGGTLWWSDGIRVRSQDGRVLELPGPIPTIICPIWIGQNLHDAFDRGVPAPPLRTGLRAALARCVRGPGPSLPEPGRSRSFFAKVPPAEST